MLFLVPVFLRMAKASPAARRGHVFIFFRAKLGWAKDMLNLDLSRTSMCCEFFLDRFCCFVWLICFVWTLFGWICGSF